jgi:hypothetical protein
MAANNSDVLLELNLLDNGIDFILKGIDELFDESHVLRGHSDPVDVSANRYKYGILHLFSGFLLLLKERLSRHLPELIFKGKIAEAKQKLASGKTPNTVDLDEALERLEMGPKVTFSDDELRVIRSVQDFRNQFEHYKVSANKYHLWAIVSAFLALIDSFLVRDLQINIEASADSNELREKIQTLESVWKRIDEQRKKNWQEEIDRKLENFQSIRAEVLADLEFTYRSDKGATEVLIDCPECGEETLIVYGEYRGICSNEECNATYPITQCDRCGVTISTMLD